MDKLLIRATLIIGGMLLLSGTLLGVALRFAIPDWDFSKTGPMGDAFGGFLSPVMNLIGAVLVYFSFKQQQEANKLQFKALKEDRERVNALNKFKQIVNLMDDVKKLYESFEVRYQQGNDPSPVIRKGQKAFKKFNEHLADSKQGIKIFNQIKIPRTTARMYINFLKVLAFTSNTVANYDYKYDHSKDVLLMKFINLISDFQKEVSSIVSHSSTLNEKTATEIQILTEEFTRNVKIIRKQNYYWNERSDTNPQ